MTEKITKQYYCDWCGKEINPKSESAIRCFTTGQSSGISSTIRQLPQLVDKTRQVYVNIEPGDFCNVLHFAEFIKNQMDRSRGRPANDEVAFHD